MPTCLLAVQSYEAIIRAKKWGKIWLSVGFKPRPFESTAWYYITRATIRPRAILWRSFQVINFLRSTVPRSIVFRNVLPIFAETPERPALQSSLPPLSDHVSVTRTFCGALFFPTIASFLGKALFDQVSRPYNSLQVFKANKIALVFKVWLG